MNKETVEFIRMAGEFHRGHPSAQEWSREELVAQLEETLELIELTGGISDDRHVLHGIKTSQIDLDKVAEWIQSDEEMP